MVAQITAPTSANCAAISSSGERRAPAGDRLQLVERAAGVPEPAPGQLRHRRAARRDERRERQGDLVADAAGGVLVDQRSPDVAEREHLAGVDHRLGPAARLGRVHPVQEDRHGQGGHLLVGDVAAGVRGDHPVDLLVGQPPAVPLGDDHIDGADPHRSLAHGRDASPPGRSDGLIGEVGWAERLGEQLRQRGRAPGRVDQTIRPAELVEHLPAPPTREEQAAVARAARHRHQPSAAGRAAAARPACTPRRA